MTKEEQKEYNRKYYIENKKKIKENQKEYYETNKDKISEANRNWCINNIERNRELKRNWNKNNKDKIEIYQNEHKEEIDEYQKKWREDHKDELKEYFNEYYLENKDKISNQGKEYREKNKVLLKEKKKIQYQKNKETIKEKNRERWKTDKFKNWRRQYNENHKYISSWRYVLKNSLIRMNREKNDKTIHLLGYSSLDLKNRIESLFSEGMNWEQRNLWEIDHIIPVSIFKVDTPMNIVNCLENLRPLWIEENRSKHNKVEQNEVSKILLIKFKDYLIK